MSEDEPRKLIRREAASLGWLTQSSVQPKKRMVIEGVSNASLVSLRSQLARKQEEAASTKAGTLDEEELRARRRRRGGPDLRSNAGVSARDARDRAALATPGDALAASVAALERKAALYDRLAAGEEVEAPPGAEYEVDFALKPPPDSALAAAGAGGGGMLSADMAAERARRDWEAEVEANRARESAADDRRRARREAISELMDETSEGRAAALEARAAAQHASAARTAALKVAFLRKQVAAQLGKRRAGEADAAT